MFIFVHMIKVCIKIKQIYLKRIMIVNLFSSFMNMVIIVALRYLFYNCILIQLPYMIFINIIKYFFKVTFIIIHYFCYLHRNITRVQKNMFYTCIHFVLKKFAVSFGNHRSSVPLRRQRIFTEALSCNASINPSCPAQSYFNEHHGSDRSVVEKAFGVGS